MASFKPTIIFQDSDIIVLDKPAGLVVDPSDTQKSETLFDFIKLNFQANLDRAGIVHRLDKNTSGLIIVAKTQEALENLQAQFKERKVKKGYLALVHGHLEKDITVSEPIERNPASREKFMVSPFGKEATTRFIPEKTLKFSDQKKKEVFSEFNNIQKRKLERINYGNFTLVLCNPLTGRTHQIRVHLKHFGFPIVGDEKYGGRKTTRLDHRWCSRQFLHAAKIEFTHPQTKERVVFESSLPQDLKQALDMLDTVVS